MHVDVYLKDPYDTLTIHYPPRWELGTQTFKIGSVGTADPLQMSEYMRIKVTKADPAAY